MNHMLHVLLNFILTFSKQPVKIYMLYNLVTKKHASRKVLGL